MFISIDHLELLVAIVTSFVASSGFWLFLSKKTEEKDLTRKLLVGLAHDRITYLSEKYLDRGWITHDEYENLHDFLYEPYVEMGGNGSAKRLMIEVDKLSIVQKNYIVSQGKVKNVSEQ